MGLSACASSKAAEQEVDMKKPRAILTLGGLVEPSAPARPQRPLERDACCDAIAALADAGLPLFERMRAEGRCLPMKIDIWREITSRTDPVSHVALKVQIEVLTRSRPYLAACAEPGAMRHDLDGEAVEPVTAQHRHRATRLRSGRKN
jgi:sRNA-binding protein